MMRTVSWPLAVSRQREWRYLILLAFFLGGLAAGLYFLSYLFDFREGIIASLFIMAFGKGGAHILYLGRPLRAWRAVSRPQSSWLSRGLIGVVLFLVLGSLELVPGVEGTGLGVVMGTLALFCALWVMVYTGFLMARSPAIPFWNTTLLPVLFTLYGFIAGMDLLLASLVLVGEGAIGVEVMVLEKVEASLLLGALLSLGVYTLVMYGSSPAARAASLLWLRGDLALHFLGGVVFLGLVVPLALLSYPLLTGDTILPLAAAAGLLGLLGGLLFRWCVLRAGVYTPLL